MTDPDPRPPGNSLSLSLPFRRLFQRLSRRTEDKQELIDQLREAQASSVINADAVSMMEGVLQVSDLIVRDLMVPRSQMDVVDIHLPLAEMLRLVTKTAHSRFPVIDGDKDEVVGILLAKDLLRVVSAEHASLRDLLRPAIFVPETKRVDVLLRDFRLNRNHLALVVDEYGSISGLITIEDVLEQIVGDIEDEHDTDEDAGNILALPNSQGRYRVLGTTGLDQFNEAFGTELQADQIETIAGYVVAQFGRVPHRRERLTAGGLEIEVQQADGRSIQKLIVRLGPEAAPQEAGLAPLA